MKNGPQGAFFYSILYPYITNNFFLQIFVLFTNNNWTTGGEENETTGRQDYGNHINHNRQRRQQQRFTSHRHDAGIFFSFLFLYLTNTLF